MLVTTEYFDEQVIADLLHANSTVTFNGILEATNMGLIVNQVALEKTLIYTAITQPTYPGYALQALTFAVASRDSDGNIRTESGLTAFQMSDATDPTLVYGYFVSTVTTNHLLWAELFSTPVSLNDALSYLGIVAIWVASNAAPGTAQIVE